MKLGPRLGQCACASCHKPELAFSDGLAVSVGIGGRKGTRKCDLRIEREGRRVRAVEINQQSLMGAPSSGQLEAEILVWNGRIGMLAGLTGESDLYIGYDCGAAHCGGAWGEMH